MQVKTFNIISESAEGIYTKLDDQQNEWLRKDEHRNLQITGSQNDLHLKDGKYIATRTMYYVFPEQLENEE